MSDFIKWEYGIVGIPAQGDLVANLDKIGEEGWEVWGVIGQVMGLGPNGEQIPVVNLGVKRHKRLISLATSLEGVLKQ